MGHYARRALTTEFSTTSEDANPLSHEKADIPGATPSDTRKATRRGALSQAPQRPGVVGDPGMCRHSLFGNREVSWLTKAACRDWSASGRRGAEADDARPREVRLRHSSGEVAEHNRGTGSGGD